MSLNLSTGTLRSLIALTEKREKLTEELAVVEQQIEEVVGGLSSPVSARKTRKISGRPSKVLKKRGKRGAVKELILAGLKEAGEKGIAVKDLGAKLGIKPQNIHVWLHTTGKKSGLVETAGKGIYRLKQSKSTETESNSSEASKPVAPKKVSKKVSKKRPGKGK